MFYLKIHGQNVRKVWSAPGGLVYWELMSSVIDYGVRLKGGKRYRVLRRLQRMVR